jgi:DNA modification methylase
VRKVLRDDGTVWINYGDAYASGGRGKGGEKQQTNPGSTLGPKNAPGYKDRDLLGLPWQLAFALRADGWYLRSAVIWAKGVSFCDEYSGSVMPESVNGWRYEKQDDGSLKLRKGGWRPTSAHEYVFMLAKSDKYFCDAEAVREPSGDPEGTAERYESGFGGAKNEKLKRSGESPTKCVGEREWDGGRNPRDVWTIGTSGTSRAHYAAFPEGLVEPMLEAATPTHACGDCGAPWAPVVDKEQVGDQSEWPSSWGNRGFKGESHEGAHTVDSVERNIEGHRPTCTCDAGKARPVVLDPFSGTATTGVVAAKMGCRYVGIDLSEEYNEMAKNRLREVITGVPEGEPEQCALWAE